MNCRLNADLVKAVIPKGVIKSIKSMFDGVFFCFFLFFRFVVFVGVFMYNVDRLLFVCCFIACCLLFVDVVGLVFCFCGGGGHGKS